MAKSVYFETTAVLELLNATAKGAEVKHLIDELRIEKTRIYTSILTVHEASVLALMRGGKDLAIYDVVNQFARIVTIDRDVAIAAARLEAAVLKHFKKGPGTKDDSRHRRRWDCLHIATAQTLGCTVLYAYDRDFQVRARQVEIGNLRIAQPTATQPTLDLVKPLLLPPQR